MKRKYIIEFLVAAVVIIVLFIAVFPKFQKAQHTAGVTKSLHDLSEIAKAMETVNQETTGEKRLKEIHQVWVKDLGEDRKSETLVTALAGFQNATSNPLRPSRIVGWGPYQHKELDALLTFDHRPPPSMLLLNNYEFKNEYLIETGAWRTFTKLIGRNPNSPTQYDTIAFDREAKLPYVGIARGPFFDPHIGRRETVQAETAYSFGGGIAVFFRNDLVSDTHYVEYASTNGIRSHGYVVYRSPAGQIANVTDFYPDFRGLPLPEGRIKR
jgi:type II secretory pathway pseudopilin PulG